MNPIIMCLYLKAGMAVMATHTSPGPGKAWNEDITQVHNPYGVIAAGCDIQHKQFTFSVEYRHISGISIRDFGTNTAEIAITYHPWRK